jgi:fructokinase
MNACALCFGEVLWDCLPNARLPGGAPLNVAYHLNKLGIEATIVSAVGKDTAGNEMLAHITRCGLRTTFVRHHPTLPTGTVPVTLDDAGHASYTIEENVAWDDIGANPKLPSVGAIVHGSLAARSAANREALKELLARPDTLRVMDVNLRPPFDDHARVLEFASLADWLKVNASELSQLTGIPAGADPSDGVRELTARTGVKRVCVTAGETGAWLFDDGKSHFSPGLKVNVVDTVGAGDAFTAALVAGLLYGEEPEMILGRACRLGALVSSLIGGQPEYDVATLRMDMPFQLRRGV